MSGKRDLPTAEKEFLDGIRGRIVETAKARGLKLPAIGKAAGVSSLTSYIKTDVRISAYFILEIARALNVSPEWLFTGRISDDTATPGLWEPLPSEVQIPDTVLFHDEKPIAIGTQQASVKAVDRLDLALGALDLDRNVYAVTLQALKADGTIDKAVK